VLPICDVLNKAGDYKFTEPFLFKVQTFGFPALFHLPPSPCGTLREGLVRFEWAQHVPIFHLRPFYDERHNIALSTDAMWLLELWFSSYLGLSLTSDDQSLLDDYRVSKMLQMEQLLRTS